MCKYCNKEDKRDIIPIETTANIGLYMVKSDVNNKNLKWYLLAEEEHFLLNLINYCPMCGRNLNEDNL